MRDWNDRDCEGCGLCCTHLAIEVLNKPAGQACRHLQGDRCGIYAMRPNACRRYECLWLRGANVPQPKASGLIIDPARWLGSLSVRIAGPVSRAGRKWVERTAKKSVLFLSQGNSQRMIGPARECNELAGIVGMKRGQPFWEDT